MSSQCNAVQCSAVRARTERHAVVPGPPIAAQAVPLFCPVTEVNAAVGGKLWVKPHKAEEEGARRACAEA